MLFLFFNLSIRSLSPGIDQAAFKCFSVISLHALVKWLYILSYRVFHEKISEPARALNLAFMIPKIYPVKGLEPSSPIGRNNYKPNI